MDAADKDRLGLGPDPWGSVKGIIEMMTSAEELEDAVDLWLFCFLLSSAHPYLHAFRVFSAFSSQLILVFANKMDLPNAVKEDELRHRHHPAPSRPFTCL